MHFVTIGCFICRKPFGPSNQSIFDPNISDARRYDCGHIFHRKCMTKQQDEGHYKCLICGLPSSRNSKEVYFVGVTVNVKEPETKVNSEESNNFNEKNDKPEKEVESARERFKRALNDGDVPGNQSELTGYF